MLERFRDLFSLVLFVSIIVSIIGGIILSNRALSPIRGLISTIKAIHAGDEGVRVQSKKTGDELDTLITLFNQMLDRIQRLIQGMRATLDNVAHDLRTPLTRFQVIADIGLRDEANDKDRKEALEEGLEAASEIQTLLNTLLDISEAESGAMKLNLELVQLKKVAQEVIDLYEILADEKNISVALSCSDEITAFVDYHRVKQVLANLLDNAIKYTEQNGQVIIDISRDNSNVIIKVSDTGVGIPSSEIPKIWDRLYRGDQSRSKRGLGLGLSLVQSVVIAHGGSVIVKSEITKGSQFEVHLPNKITEV